MSSIGKILTFVNLVLAGLFVGWAARTLNENSDWKVKHDALNVAMTKKLEDANKDLESTRANLHTQEGANAALRSEKDGFEADLRRTKETLAEKERDLGKWSADLNELKATHGVLVASNEKLHAEKDKAVQAQHDAEKARDEASAKQVSAEKELGDTKGTLEGANSKIADMEKELNSLGKSKKQVENQLASLQAYTGANLESIMAMPKIEGRVLAVTMDVAPGLISINKGNVDKVMRGFTFEIYDGTKYKGKARVEFVHETSCSAILVNVVKGETIRQGDSASTQL